MSKALEIYKILEYSGFDDSEKRTIIASDGFEIYDDIFTIGDSDIMNLAKYFSYRTVASRRIILGLRRTNLLKVTIHWAQYFWMISRTP